MLKKVIKDIPESVSLEGLFSEGYKPLEGNKAIEDDKEEIDNIPPTLLLEGNEDNFIDIQLIALLKSDEVMKKK